VPEVLNLPRQVTVDVQGTNLTYLDRVAKLVRVKMTDPVIFDG
jgi:hypothetical protein